MAAAAAGAGATAIAAAQYGNSRERLAAAVTEALSHVLLKDLLALIVEYAPALLWTADHASGGIAISNGGLTASLNCPPRTEEWNSVHSDVPLATSGVASWECHIDEMSSGGNSWGMAIGVVSSASVGHITPTSFCTGNKESFAYLCKTGWTSYCSGGGHNFGSRAVGTGDLVRCEVDHDHKTVSFWVNGNALGCAYQAGTSPNTFNGKAVDREKRMQKPPAPLTLGDKEHVQWPADGKFYACVSLTFGGQKVTIVGVN